MIKNSLKNFGKNLIYVFIPMGIVYLFLLIAVFSLIGVVFDAAGGVVRRPEALASGERFSVKLAGGQMDATKV